MQRIIGLCKVVNMAVMLLILAIFPSKDTGRLEKFEVERLTFSLF